jgi:O-antigen ligase
MLLDKFILEASKFIIASLLALLLFIPEFFSQYVLLHVGGSIYVSDLYIGAIHLIALLIMIRSVYTENTLVIDHIGFLLLLFYSVLILSMIRSIPIYGASAYGTARNFGLYTPLTLLSYFIARRTSTDTLITVLKIFAYACIVVSVSEYIFNILAQFEEPHRAFGTLKSLVITFYMIERIYYVATHKGTWHQYLLIFFLVLLIIISSQRAIWLSLVVVSIIVLVAARKISVKHMFYTLFVVCIFVIGVLSLPDDNIVKQNIVNRFVGIVNPQDDISSSTRLLTWTVSFNDFLNNPVCGEGMGDREKINFSAIGFQGEFDYVMPHNFYLTVAEQRGLVGLIPLLWGGSVLLFRFIYKIKRKSTKKNNFELLFLTFVIVVFIYRIFWNGQPILWIILGTYLALHENISSSTYLQFRRIHS